MFDLNASGPGGGIEVRDATPEDVAAIQRIYAHHVLKGIATFEEIPPSVDEMSGRLAAVLQGGLPYLVAVVSGKVVGYCYAAAYRPRPAYQYTIENSVYVEDGMDGKGVGSTLLRALIARCEQGPWRQMVAVIGDRANTSSIILHQNCGFRHVGILTGVGFKLGQWVDTVLMQRALGGGTETLPTAGQPKTGAR